MNHVAASEKLLELAYGELTPREARAVEAHAAECPDCREALAHIRETRALMSALPTEPAPERGEAILFAAAREEAGRSGRRTPMLRWLWAGGLGAVAAAAVAVVSWQLAKTGPETSLRRGEGELLGRAPPPVVAAPEPSPAQPAARAEASRPPEAMGALADEGSARRAPKVAAPPPAKREAEAKLAAKREPRERAKRDELSGWSSSPEAGAGRASEAAGAASTFGTGSGERAAAPAPPAARWKAPAEPAPAVAEAERAAAAPAPMAVPAPPPAAQAPAAAPGKKARAAVAAERKAAAAEGMEAEAPAPEPRPAAGSVETRDFPACPGELRRIVERDGEGRVVRYVRIGELREIDHRYGPGGRIVSAILTVRKVARALPLDTPGLVLNARDAGIDAPPRCAAP